MNEEAHPVDDLITMYVRDALNSLSDEDRVEAREWIDAKRPVTHHEGTDSDGNTVIFVVIGRLVVGVDARNVGLGFEGDPWDESRR